MPTWDLSPEFGESVNAGAEAEVPRQSVGGGKFIQKRVRTRYPLLKTTVLRVKLPFGDRSSVSGVVCAREEEGESRTQWSRGGLVVKTQWFRGGLVVQAPGLVYHATCGSINCEDL